MNQLIVAFRYPFLQQVRNLPLLIIFLGLPLFMIPLLGAVFASIPADAAYLRGAANASTFFAIGMMLLFQLFGGSSIMQGVTTMFLGPRRWRIHALPCRPMVIVSGMIASSTLVSLLQGLLLVTFSAAFLGIRFGNIGVVVVVLLGVALLSQLIGTFLVLLVRNSRAAFVLGWIVAYGSGLLGGVVFPLPTEIPFYRFTTTYGTPFSLAQTALLDASRGGPAGEIALCIAALFLAGALFGLLAALLGRRRLA